MKHKVLLVKKIPETFENEFTGTYYDMPIYTSEINNELNHMALHCNLYDYLWKGVDNKSEDLAPKLRAGLNLLESSPKYFSKFNTNNSKYEDLIRFTKKLLKQVELYPESYLEIT